MKFLFVISDILLSVVYKQYETKQFISLGPEKTVCYISILSYQISL